MDTNWPTQKKDMRIAKLIMEEYAREQEATSLGLFELVVNQEKKRMDFRLASWVLAIASQFNDMYGGDQGDFITRQVISRYITEGHTIH